MRKLQSSINIGYWNINKLISKQVDKSKEDIFKRSINNSDIVGLAEVKGDINNCSFDDHIPHYVERKNNKGNQSYGGLGILIRKSLKKGVKYLPLSCSEYQWLLLDKKYFGFDKDLYLCFAYIPPQYSSYFINQNIDFLELLEADISKYRNMGSVLILGDFNARTASENDFILNDDDNYLPLHEDYIIDANVIHRNSQDTKICTRGKELLEICISSRLRILNGRTFGDLHGKFTSYQYNGNSVIDYCLCSEEQMPNILYFHVDDPILRLSDHSKISVRLMANFWKDENKDSLQSFPEQFKWDNFSSQLFSEALNSEEINNKLEDFLERQINNISEINELVTDFSQILISAANKSLRKKTFKKGKVNKNRKWFDLDLIKMRKTLDTKGKLLAKHPNDPLVRGNFFKYRKRYSKMCKFKRKKYKADIIDRLDNLFENNPKAYWSLLDELKENKTNSVDSTTSEEMFDHFSKLNTLQSKFQNRIKEIEEILENKENNRSFSGLDFLVTKEEVSKCLHSLKNGKSAGLDRISNEMLKYGESTLLPYIVKIFNSVLQVGVYPNNWKLGYINPIHKSGTRSDPSNYRGINIMSCLGKLFNSVLNARLDEFLNANNVISKTQIGFQKQSRTTDHMFVLRTIIEKYTKQSKSQLFTCFIDFKKAFDSVLHQALFLKMQNIGVNGLFYNIVKNMYLDNILQVKIGHNLTNDFHSELGVRQGDTLSPNLFKIFINDLADIFDNECGAISLGTFNLNCLMYADDVILISQSESGLQNCLKKLERYCELWCLDINIDKTKTVIFNKSGKLLPYQFYFTGKPIENVKTYKYLGVVFAASGCFSQAKSDLYNRGLKAFFKLKSIFGDVSPSIDTCLHIFDHTIKPILLYGSEVWGACSSVPASVRNEPDFKLEKAYMNFECEKLSTKYYKYILGVHKRATNLAVIGELGRTPHFIDIICGIIKYFKRIEAMNSNSLLVQTLKTSKELHDNGKQCWYTGLKYILDQLNIDETVSIDAIKSNLIKRSMQYWEKQIKEIAVVKQGKLRTYYTFKSTFKKEIYLKAIKNRDVRKCFTQFRISAHQLAIERGRYRNIKATERICKYCNKNETEDELHFLVKCQKYSTERHKLFSYIEKECKNFKDLNEESKFMWLMANEDIDIIQKLSSHIFACFEVRKQQSSNQ